MAKKKKVKLEEVVCFCAAKADVEKLLRREIVQQGYPSHLFGVLAEEQVYELEAMLASHLRVEGTRVFWSADAPPIEVVREEGRAAKMRADMARETLADLLRSQPNAWFARDRTLTDELREKLGRCRELVTFRWPDVETEPVSNASFWVCSALAKALASQTSGVVMPRDGAFTARGGDVIE